MGEGAGSFWKPQHGSLHVGGADLSKSEGHLEVREEGVGEQLQEELLGHHVVHPVQEQKGSLLVRWEEPLVVVRGEGDGQDPHDLLHLHHVLQDVEGSLGIAVLLLASSRLGGGGAGLGGAVGGAGCTAGQQTNEACIEGQYQSHVEHGEAEEGGGAIHSMLAELWGVQKDRLLFDEVVGEGSLVQLLHSLLVDPPEPEGLPGQRRAKTLRIPDQ